MHTNQYLKYTSHNPTSAKQIVITALFDRADNVVSNKKDKIEEKHHILAALQQNGYLNNIYPKNSQKAQQEKRTAKRALRRNKPKASTYLTSKESVSSLNEQLISTTSKQHFTPRQPSVVYY